MPMNRKLYPQSWDLIAAFLKNLAGWTCINCGRPCRKPGETIAAFSERVATDKLNECPLVAEIHHKPGRFVLTVAHLNHIPSDCRPENLAPWCSVCHGRYDLKAIPLKRHIKLERQGQLRLPL